MSDRAAAIATALAEALGERPVAIAPRARGGGSINAAATFDAHGRTWFVKWNDHALPRQFEAEAAGLEALRAADSGLVVPRAVAFSDAGPGRSFLILEHLETGPRRDDFDELLGRGLARLHACTDERGFGFDLDGTCGATPQANGWRERWVDFYRHRRLEPQLERARARGLPADGLRLLERLVDRLVVVDPLLQ
ncbi:MAG: fructosamine kinase family protein, partial [Planctomycetota bacterium JB042]